LHLGGRAAPRKDVAGFGQGRLPPAGIENRAASNASFAKGSATPRPPGGLRPDLAGGVDQRGPRTRFRKRACSPGSRKLPVNWVVTVDTPAFCTPRIAMHKCSASIMTAAARGFRMSSIAGLAWVVQW